MTQRRRITIRDVAEAAGVSAQTVSRVLNNHPDVAVDTLERVQQIIKETGYAPNILARSLIRGRSHTIGVVAFGLKYFGPSRVLTGIEERAAEMGYSIFLNLLNQPESNAVDHLLDAIFARQVDGIIWAIPEIGNNRSWAKARSNDFPVPVMFVGGTENRTSLPLVGIDNRAIGRLATEHLLAGGARRVGIITGPESWWEAQQRRQGWSQTLTEHGLAPEDRQIAVGDWDAKSGEQGLYQLLAQCPDIDAVFASNDQIALGVLYAAHRLGKRVPDELSVVGVDDMPDVAHFWPPLSTVRQGLRQAGGMVVQQLDQMIRLTNEGEVPAHGPSPTLLLQPELIVRESSRVAKS